MKIKRILIVAGSIFLVIAICLIAFEIKEYIDYEEYVFVDKVYSTIELGKSNYTINNDSNFGYFYNNGKVTIDDISDDILIEVTLKKLSKYKENDYRISKYNLNKEIYKKEEIASMADTLLDFENINTSFVIGRINEDEISISARSISKLDVGKIMEKLDGGGSKNEAATKLKLKSVKEAEKKLKNILDKE